MAAPPATWLVPPRPAAHPLDRLVWAVWQQALRDLAAGRRDARAWLDSPDFVWLVDLTLGGADPAAVRAVLLRRHWRPPPSAPPPDLLL